MKGKKLRVASCELRVNTNAKPQAAFGLSSQLATGNSQLPFAFTLIELLVTIGIIALLVGVLVPVVTKSIGKAHRIRLQSDLQTISAALESYRSDFGDYPRASFGGVTNADTGHPDPPTGAEMLCRALIGPAPATDSSTNPPIPAQDGADGPGFRLRGTSGRVYGPYLAADKFKVFSLYASSAGGLPTETSSNQPLAAAGGTFYPLDAVIADIDGNPILYFPARALKPDITNAANQGYIGSVANAPTALGTLAPGTQFSLFNADDNWIYMHYFFHDGQVDWRSGTDGTEAAANSGITTQGFKRICIMLGDYDSGNTSATTNCDGAIDSAAEHPINEPFLLWCAGKDGKFGTDSVTPMSKDINKLDDATNIP